MHIKDHNDKKIEFRTFYSKTKQTKYLIVFLRVYFTLLTSIIIKIYYILVCKIYYYMSKVEISVTS